MSILEAFLAGKEARRVADAQEQINAMQSFIGQNGQAIMAGDQNALGQLAGFGAEGLGMAMNVQSNVEARADRAYNRTRQEKADARGDQEWEMRLEEYKAGKTAAELAAEAARIEEAVKVGLAAKTPEEFDALMIQMGAPELAGQFASREALAMKGMSMAEAFKAANPEPAKPADDYQRYVQEETAAGRKPLTRIEFANAMKGKGVTMRTQNADGSVTEFSVGGASDGGEIEVGDVYNPAAASDAVGLINDILGADQSGNVTPEGRATIESITGPVEGGGGNDIDAMSSARRMWYGEAGLDKIEKLNQLQSKAWLAARDMLKGGGPITDYESKKAEGAVARLSRAKGPEEFIAALTELRDAITAGEAKLRAARDGNAPAATPAPATGGDLSDEDLLRKYGGE